MKNVMPLIHFLICLFFLAISSCSKDNDLFTEALEEDISQNIDEQINTPDDIINDDEPQSNTTDGTLKAFPTAYGGGSVASGGRGGVLIFINTHDVNAPLVYDEESNTYSGGLQPALTLSQPRYIVFNISGYFYEYSGGDNIGLGSLSKSNHNEDNLTIFGQSAPEGGVTIKDGFIRFMDVDNVIIRYMRVRPRLIPGDPAPDDRISAGFLFHAGQDQIVDHCSFSFANDKAINFYAGKDHVNMPQHGKTVQRSIMADSHTSMYMGTSTSGDQAKADDLSVIYNLFGRGTNRLPSIRGNNDAEVVNNVMHQWASKPTLSGGSQRLNHINNYYKQAPGDGYEEMLWQSGSNNNPQIFTSGNFYTNVLSGNSAEDNSIIWKDFTNRTEPLPDGFFVKSAWGGIPNSAPLLSAEEAYENVLSDVGANKYLDNEGYVKTYLDTFDQGTIDDVINNKEYQPLSSANWIQPVLPENSRPSNYDTDKDGMSDAWEIRVFGNLSQGYNDDYDGDGYTNIEEYMNQVDFR